MSDDTAATMRSAAKLMRERAEAASPGPWKFFLEGRDHWGGDSIIQTGGDYDLTLDLTPQPTDVSRRRQWLGQWSADQDCIAGMHPGVALAVADWLEETADQYEGPKCDAPGVCNGCEKRWDFVVALRAATEYLGKQ